MNAEKLKELADRVDRWQKHFGEPMGNGRANPDNDLIYLLEDCSAALNLAASMLGEDAIVVAIDSLRESGHCGESMSAAMGRRSRNRILDEAQEAILNRIRGGGK